MAKFDSRAFMAGVRREAGERGGAPRWRSLAALLRLEGNDFIMAAYRAALRREADPAGLRDYAARTRSLPGRVAVLLSLLLSAEQTALPAPARRALMFCRRSLRRWRAGRKT